MNASHLKYSNITQHVIGRAMKVHSWFGPGFPEVIYQRSLIIKLEKAGLKSASEVVRDVYYEDYLVGNRRLDILVEDKVLVELKVISELDYSCYNKIINYLKVFKLEVGLLLNFGTQRLQYKRFVN